MDDVDEHQDEDRGINRQGFEGQGKGEAQHQTRNGQGQHADKMQGLIGRRFLKTGGGIGRKIREAGAYERRQQRDRQGIDRVEADAAGQQLAYIGQGEGHVDGVLFDETQADERQDRQTD